MNITYRITVNLNDDYHGLEDVLITDFSSVESAVKWCKNHNLKIDEETQAEYISYDGCLWVDEKIQNGYGVEYTNAYTTLEKIIIL